MKKVMMLTVLAFLSIGLFANEKDGDFVQTTEKVYFFKNLRHGANCFLVGVRENGEKIKFSKEDVVVYKKDGEQFEKMPVVKDNACTEDYCFMKVVAYKNGLKVYKHEYFDRNGEITSRHYVFKQKEFVVKFDNANMASLTAFFEKN